MEKLQQALKQTKNSKAPGLDNNHHEFLKHLGINFALVIAYMDVQQSLKFVEVLIVLLMLIQLVLVKT